MIPDTECDATAVLENHAEKAADAVMRTLKDSRAFLGNLNCKDEKIGHVDVERVAKVGHARPFDVKIFRRISDVGILVRCQPGFRPRLVNLL